MKSIIFFTASIILFESCRPKVEVSSTKLLEDRNIKDGTEIYTDSPLRSNLTKSFANSQRSFNVHHNLISLHSPLDKKINLLSRFGTPTLGKWNNEENQTIGISYFHEGLDIAAENPSPQPDSVYAPVTGIAKIVYDAYDENDVKGYATSIFIQDESSNVLVGLLHVNPDSRFNTHDFINVKKGEKIGSLANVLGVLPDLPKYRHTHLMLIDFEKKSYIDPSRYLEGYKDELDPHIFSISFYDESKTRYQTIKNGKLDIVINSSDKDTFSTYNQEIAEISTEVKNNRGQVLFSLKKCKLEDVYFNQLFLKNVFNVINIAPIFDSIEIESANIARDNIEFEYAVTNLKINEHGRCEIIEDKDGYIDIIDPNENLLINVEVKDHFGNSDTKIFKFDGTINQ